MPTRSRALATRHNITTRVVSTQYVALAQPNCVSVTRSGAAQKASIIRRKVDKYFDVVDWKVPGLTVDGSLEPVVIYVGQQLNDITFLEAELSLVFGLKVVQRFTTWTLGDACSKNKTY